ncbi:AEC family transporter [bacterium]|nr:AEC family transporter [bacterium]
MHLLNSLLPVFLIIVVGLVLSRTKFISKEQFEGLTKLTYWVGLPCFLFYKIATATDVGDTAILIVAALLISMIVTMAVGYAFAYILRVPSDAQGTFVQAAFRGNLAFVGLPVIIYSMAGTDGLATVDPEMLGILVLAPVVPIYNVVSIVILLISKHQLDRSSWQKLFRPLATNPLLMASLAGGLVWLLSLELPVWVSRTTEAIGRMSLPLALLSIGGSLATVKVSGRLGHAGGVSLIKTIFSPLIGLLIVRLMQLGSLESRIALIYLACPTSAVSFVMANRIGGDNALAASAVVISTILAAVSLGLVLGLGF